MNIHKHARLTPRGRERIVRMAAAGSAPAVIARVVGVSLKTGIAHFACGGVAGLADRSSRPRRLHRPTADDQVEQIIAPSGRAARRSPGRRACRRPPSAVSRGGPAEPGARPRAGRAGAPLRARPS